MLSLVQWDQQQLVLNLLDAFEGYAVTLGTVVGKAHKAILSGLGGHRGEKDQDVAALIGRGHTGTKDLQTEGIGIIAIEDWKVLIGMTDGIIQVGPIFRRASRRPVDNGYRRNAGDDLLGLGFVG